MVDEAPRALEHLVAQLKESVAPSPTLKAHVLVRAREHGVPRRSWFRLRLVVTMAAAVAGMAVFVMRDRFGRTESPDATRLVPFVFTATNAGRVALVGDFNNWDVAATPMQRAGPNAWWVVVQLRPGRYRYSFVINGTRWMMDPGAPRAADNDFGPRSSVITILAKRA